MMTVGIPLSSCLNHFDEFIPSFWTSGVTLVFTSCVATLVPPVLALLRGSPPKSCDTQPFKSDDNVSLIPERLKSFLLVFSIPRNVSNLFSRKGILLIDGLKGLGIVCTIVFHREIFGLAYAKNLEYFEEGIHSLSFCLLTASTFLLDIFFFFSGYLLAWPIIENLNRKRTVNFFNIIVNRVFRPSAFVDNRSCPKSQIV
ncbi:uncharacterized protein LOC103513281 [Diaphorina citri]|uniref:Uncharacterized protein LOC103513281 n=1 Tax=Diaphorina citri TaxID=121845 RepID=A0A3Q0J1K1_DIACI|nr:uncharacterized protein LOC103513281 [Diaphorina citri]